MVRQLINQLIIGFSMILSLFMLSSCSVVGGYSQGIGFSDYDEFRAMFADNILYPTYLPEGFDFISNNKDNNIRPRFASVFGHTVRREPWTVEELPNAGISISRLDSQPGATWDWLDLSISVLLDIDSAYRLIEGDVYTKHGIFDIYLREGYDPHMLRSDEEYADIPGLPYYKYYLTYTFFDEGMSRKPYSFTFLTFIYTQDNDGTVREHLRSYYLDEAIKIFEGLASYTQSQLFIIDSGAGGHTGYICSNEEIDLPQPGHILGSEQSSGEMA